MFEWKRKQLENDQVKFFGGTHKKFISCYAKQVKPRIKIKLKPIKDSIRINFNPRYAIGYSQKMANQQQLIGMQNINNALHQGGAAAYGLGGGSVGSSGAGGGIPITHPITGMITYV